MLTTESYWIGLSCYALAALIGCVLIHRYWLAGVRSPWRGLITAWLAALLLTPALPSPEASTLAPALVTFLFNMAFAGGLEAAKGSGFALIAAWVVATLVVFFMPRRRARTAPAATPRNT